MIKNKVKEEDTEATLETSNRKRERFCVSLDKETIRLIHKLHGDASREAWNTEPLNVTGLNKSRLVENIILKGLENSEDVIKATLWGEG